MKKCFGGSLVWIFERVHANTATEAIRLAAASRDKSLPVSIREENALIGKKNRIIVMGLLGFLVLCLSPGCAGNKPDIDKSAFTAGAVIGGNITLISANMPTSEKTLKTLEAAMTQLQLSAAIQKQTIDLMRKAGEEAKSKQLDAALKTTVSAKETMSKEIYNKHGQRARDMVNFGTCAMTAVEMTQSVELAYQRKSSHVDTIIYEGLATPLAGMKLTTAKIDNLSSKVQDEVRAALAPFGDRVCTREEVRVIRGHLIKLLKLYGLAPLTNLTPEGENIRVE